MQAAIQEQLKYENTSFSLKKMKKEASNICNWLLFNK